MRPISVLDLSPVPPGGSARTAFATSVALAQAAEAWGFDRYWVAEHHGVGAAIAGSCPEVLVARIASVTSTMRVGSGTSLLNYTTPMRLAETFRGLDALFPGRIDVGIGRAAAPPIIDSALRPGPSEPWEVAAEPVSSALDAMASWMDYEDQVTEVIAWLNGGFAIDDPRARVSLVAGEGSAPQPWLLGSSLTSAMLAGRLGLPYGYAAFFNPAEATRALRMYRACFAPSPFPGGLAEPRSILAVNACCAATEEAATRLRASVELFYTSGGDVDRPALAPADQAVVELGEMPVQREGTWPRHFSGDPPSLRARLEAFATEAQADEIMVQDLIADPVDRLRSYQLIAGAFGLTADVVEAAAGSMR